MNQAAGHPSLQILVPNKACAGTHLVPLCRPLGLAMPRVGGHRTPASQAGRQKGRERGRQLGCCELRA